MKSEEFKCLKCGSKDMIPYSTELCNKSWICKSCGEIRHLSPTMNENVIYEYDQLYEKFNDCVKALFFACNLIHNFSKEYDKESDCCNCICDNCIIHKALDKAYAIKEVSEE